MRTPRNIRKYAQENYSGVSHTTFNPKGPGVVRIHLVPPNVDEGVVGPAVAIINGQDILPVNPSWTILLNEYIKEVNNYHEKELSDQEVDLIMKNTCKRVRKVFPLLSKKRITNDLYTILNTFKQVAYREEVTTEIGYMSLGEYASFMKAPHRMDIMVSAMTKNEKWHCNQKCIHCYAAGQVNADEAELSTEEWKQIIDKCQEIGIPQLTFTGGEPTMREDLVELVEHAQWFVTRLNTNGIKMTKDLCKALYDASLDSVQFTFYSCDADIHNHLVGASGFEQTVSGIENALEAGLNISINTPLCTMNKDYVKTLEFLYEKGVQYVTCSGLITTGNATTEASENLQLSTEEMKTILKEATEFCFSHEMEISFTSPGWVEDSYCEELGINAPSCGACLSNMAVTPGGNVVPCQSWLSDDTLGNMLTDDWKKIWEHPFAAERRNFSAQMTGLCPLRKYREGGAC